MKLSGPLALCITAITAALECFVSCSANCRQETVAKPEWIIRTVTYSVDTLLHYTVTDNKVEVVRPHFSGSRDELTHTVTIRNDSKRYTGSFSVHFRFECWSYNGANHWDDWEEVQTAAIEPNTDHTFTKKWYGGKPDDSNARWFDSKARISQSPRTVTLTRSVHELLLKDTTVNNCECDVDALKAEYRAIQDIFGKLKHSNLIQTK
jgi:hypothetical protein